MSESQLIAMFHAGTGRKCSDRIQISWRSCRVACTRAGKRPNTITPEKLKIGVSYVVNPIIVNFTDNLRYDRRGRDLPTVYCESLKIGRPAEFIELGEEFRVIPPLPNRA
ncbi:hypothetical protein [Thiobaca trueperi]|uniref:Uncharacterized protein n=1 Tax=Thiobaca trueperi TaxID=127458 RepID=A0A4R3MZL7_9GAMM|nr:hypothetical protein [Thiobaca trueperi]TCT19779.1 hypothetical protein EDC35_107107 [Thiobaca trueperi]